MTIQEDLQFYRRDGKVCLVGFVDAGEEGNAKRQMHKPYHKHELAVHVLQLQFLGFSGFRFSLAHFPTRTCSATELYTIVWNAVKHLRLHGFITSVWMELRVTAPW